MVDDFIRGLAMMRKHDPQVQEDGFGLVKGVAAAHVAELSSAYAKESEHGLRCWLLELLGETRSPEALPVLIEALDSPDESIRHWGVVGLKKATRRSPAVCSGSAPLTIIRSDLICREECADSAGDSAGIRSERGADL